MNSTKSVIDKLNLNKYTTKLILNMPEDIHDFDKLDFDTSVNNDKYDLLFVFIFSQEEFTKHLQTVVEKKLIADNGYMFVAYPKKNNKKYEQYIERDSFYNDHLMDEEGYVPGSSLKFARMISLNDVFTVVGLKSVPKKVKASASSKKSQCVDDYIEYIETIKQYLTNKEDLLRMYSELTPGYQKDWARYVYSAKREETQEKRLLEMEVILGEGYKSIDLYRRNKK